VSHTIYKRGVVILKSVVEEREITFSNWIRIGGKRLRLDELPDDSQVYVANSFIYLLQLFLIRKSYRPPKGGLGGQAWRGGYE